MSYKILDDLVPKKLQDDIENICIDPNFPYYFSKESTYVTLGNKLSETDNSLKNYKGSVDSFHFIHYLWRNNTRVSNKFLDFMPLIEIMAEQINIRSYPDHIIPRIYRAKINFTVPTSTPKKNKITPPHIDVSDLNTTTFVYYISDSDGHTVIFKDKYEDGKIYNKLTVAEKVETKKGRMIVFDDNIHSILRPKQSDYRIVLNVNFFK